MSNAVRPIKDSFQEDDVVKLFLKLPRLVFVTINANKGLDFNLRLNKIGKWSDFLRKISSNFLIVRELTNGIHFHALVSLNKDKKMKYIKHVHFNYQEVSAKPQIPDREFDHMVLCESGLTGEEVDAVLDVRAAAKKKRRKALALTGSMSKTECSVRRIVHYILKDNPSKVFEDYIYMDKGIVNHIPKDVAVSALACSRSASIGDEQSEC